MKGGEVDMLLFALDRSRAQFAWKCGGLDAAGPHQPFPSSRMTLAGLIKHLALVEDSYTAEDDPPEELYVLWSAAVDRLRVAWRRLLAGGDLDQPSAYRTSEGESPNLRRPLVDLHDEYARHVGHADLLREAVDGLVGEDPPQPG